MRLRTLSALSGIALLAGACTAMQTQPPLYGNYENVDDQSLCLGMMAFAADFPHAVWPGQSKAFYAAKKENYSIQSTALYKITVKKYGKQEAGERGITGYSSAKSLVYVLGAPALLTALDRCQGVADHALEVDAEYQNFLNHLGEKPADPALPEVVATPTIQPEPMTREEEKLIEGIVPNSVDAEIEADEARRVAEIMEIYPLRLERENFIFYCTENQEKCISEAK